MEKTLLAHKKKIHLSDLTFSPSLFSSIYHFSTFVLSHLIAYKTQLKPFSCHLFFLPKLIPISTQKKAILLLGLSKSYAFKEHILEQC